jgi:hypothetical protein
MIQLFNNLEFNNAKSRTSLPLRCKTCNETFFAFKSQIQAAIKEGTNMKLNFCSIKCVGKSQQNRVITACKQCTKQIIRLKSEYGKSLNHFCSKSCSALYRNSHKTKGTRRSKLEAWIETKLKEAYPNLKILFNSKEAINSELDIYIPSLKLAFELNGIFHYEPIYGSEKLASIQNNDDRKFQACIEKGIELCILDTSLFRHFKEQKAKIYLEIINKIIISKQSAF